MESRCVMGEDKVASSDRRWRKQIWCSASSAGLPSLSRRLAPSWFLPPQPNGRSVPDYAKMCTRSAPQELLRRRAQTMQEGSHADALH